MPQVTDADIDPRLLAESNESDDPAMALFRQAQCVAATSLSASISSFSDHGDDNPNGDEDEDLPATVTIGTSTMISSAPQVLSSNFVNSRLAGLARVIKSAKSFKQKSEADIDKYCGALDSEERNLLSYILGIEIRERLDDLASPSSWNMSEALKKNITLYAKVFVLSATTKSYKGNGPGHILQAMRELETSDLPADKDVLQVAEVLSFISERLTSARNILKVKIKESIELDSSIANIADLAQSLIAKTPIKHTLQLYIRLAFLRWHMLKYGDDTDYWDKVDGTLSKWVMEAKSEQDLTVSFNLVYQEDVKQYGDPASTNYKVAQPAEVEDWFKTVEKHASAAQGGTRKRKRTY